MSASQLIAKIRRNGGRVWLDELGRLNAEGASDTQMAELARSYDLAVAVLHDQIASVRWEITGKNPKLWRVPECAWTYPDQTIKPLPELVHIWATEKCVGSPRGSTNALANSWLGLAWDRAVRPSRSFSS